MDALITLYSELAKPLTAYARGFVGEMHLAEDIVSEAFVRATEYCIAKNELPARAWFYKVTRNIAIDFIRRHKKIEYTDVPEKADESREASPELALEHSERREELYTCLSKISEPYKSVLILKEFNNLTYAEIAGVIGVSLDNVKVILFRARQKLRDLYRREHGDEV